ncbi:MAG: ATP-binding protein [Telluria sp.]|nr:ATP-binding protein [Telluria sp.]
MAEDDEYEYKSSRVSFDDLRVKLSVAASAFWNTGGGILVVGVDGSGKPDGGIDVAVGKQTLRDWVDVCLAAVHPPGPYEVRMLEGAEIVSQPGKCLLLVGFGPSHMGPHMARDNRYYIRAGAHSVRAASYIVESLFARRQLTRPMLRPLIRVNPHHGRAVQLGLVAASPAHALDVSIQVPPLRLIKDGKIFQVSAIGPETPFFFDFDFRTLGKTASPPFDLTVAYADAAGQRFTETFVIDVERQLGEEGIDHTADNMRRDISDIARSLQELVNVSHELTDGRKRRS